MNIATDATQEFPAVRIDDDRLGRPPTVEERLDRVERQQTILLDELGRLRAVVGDVADEAKRRSGVDDEVLAGIAALKNAATAQLLQSQFGSSDLKGQQILVAEDEETLLPFIRGALTAAGAVVHYEADATKALATLERVGPKHFTAAVLDVRLPDSEGTELAHQIRRRVPTAGVVLISGWPMNEVVQAAKLHKFVLLHKPFKQRELVEGVLDAIILRNPDATSGSITE